METLTMPPIERCPQEILENIFLACLPLTHEADRDFTPLKLSHVCAWWRRIAFHLSPLWRSLYLAKNSKKISRYEMLCLDSKRSRDASATENMRLLAKVWADNARDLSLSVHLEMHTPCHGIGDILTSYANRLRFLRLQVLPSYTGVHMFEPFINLTHYQVDQLESLHLSWNYSSGISFNNITTFTCAPNLHKLRLDFSSIDLESRIIEPSFNSYYFMIRWSQLTHVCMDNISVETWDDLLQSCPKLQECLVTFSNFSDATSSLVLAQTPTSIPHLTKLGVNLGRSGGLFSFDKLDMPVLDTLQISAKPWKCNERARKFDWHHSLVPSFKWLGNLTILTVSLQDMSTRVDDFVGILPYTRSLRNLTVLYLETGSDVETIVQSLTYDPMHCSGEGEIKAPKLKCLKLEMANTYDLRPATETLPPSIRNFINCRWRPKVVYGDSINPHVSSLNKCDIGMVFFRKRGAKTFFNHVDRLLEPFKSQGLHVQVYESHCCWTHDELPNSWW
ncbi:hypothetical protein AX17_005573 [Amanita inopinata Kibby_2008]|nr:hypothetical protein AX17_005573 [Amanita inopinata Kibby_2008]